MSKYTILALINMPFVLYGFFSAYLAYKKGSLGRNSFYMRLGFWTIIALGLVFAKNVYDFLRSNDLTDSPPLSLADVLLVTGVVFCLFLCLRLYAKLERTRRQLTELNEKLAIILSEHKK